MYTLSMMSRDSRRAILDYRFRRFERKHPVLLLVLALPIIAIRLAMRTRATTSTMLAFGLAATPALFA